MYYVAKLRVGFTEKGYMHYFPGAANGLSINRQDI